MIEELSELELCVLKFIIDFLDDHDYSWFSFQALMRYYWRHPIRERVTWHTVARTIRKLRKKGVLIRLPSRRGRYKVQDDVLLEFSKC